MKLLILGGTQFIGRHLTETALAAGHNVTLFNRNRRGAGFPEVETLVGDRQTDVSALAGKTWDAVIDTSAYTPGAVQRTAELLQNSVGHYTFISSVSVYRDFSEAGMNEDAPVGTMTDEEAAAAETIQRPDTGTIAAVYGPKYGPLKVRCERIVETAFPGRALVIRPGLVIGPYDYSDRFTYWVRRVGLAGKDWATDVLAPGEPKRRAQFIDARDLAAWTLEATVAKVTGSFNATGPDYTLGFGDFLETTRRVLSSEAEFVWVEDAFLLERGVEVAELMPWLPAEAMPGWEGFFDIDISRAIERGLTFRPLDETIRDTFAWDQSRDDEPLEAGLTAEREATLLEKWRQR